jgi:hypothetical protein
MPEIRTFGRAENAGRRSASLAAEKARRGRRSRASKFEFAEGHLNRVKVRGIPRRYEAVVPADAIELRLLTILWARRSSSRTISFRRHHLIVPKSGYESDRVRGPLRHRVIHPPLPHACFVLTAVQQTRLSRNRSECFRAWIGPRRPREPAIITVADARRLVRLTKSVM